MALRRLLMFPLVLGSTEQISLLYLLQWSIQNTASNVAQQIFDLLTFLCCTKSIFFAGKFIKRQQRNNYSNVIIKSDAKILSDPGTLEAKTWLISTALLIDHIAQYFTNSLLSPFTTKLTEEQTHSTTPGKTFVRWCVFCGKHLLRRSVLYERSPKIPTQFNFLSALIRSPRNNYKLLPR